MKIKKFRLYDYKDFIAIIIVVLATDFAPPFLRILGSRAWTALGITEGQWTIFQASRGLVFIFFVLAAGVLGDLLGRRRMLLLILTCFIFCIPILVVSSLFSALFLVTYTIWAIFGVMIKTLSVTFIVLRYDKRERVIAVIIYSIISGTGFLLSPLLATTLNQHIGINSSFIAPLVLGVIGFWLAKKELPESRISYDVWGLDAIALGIWTFGLCTMIYGGVLSGGLGWTHPLVLGSLGVGALLMVAVSWLSGQPVLGKWKFKLGYDGKLGIAIFSGLVLYLAFYAVSVQVFNFMNRVQKVPTILSGIGLAPILLGALTSVMIARWTSRREIGQIIAAGLVVISIPALILSLLQPSISYWLIFPSLILLGFGFLLANSPRLLLLYSAVPRSLAATAQSIGSATAHLGSALAYSFMITLIEGFGVSAYIQRLESFGLNPQQIAFRISSLAKASEEISVLSIGEEEAQILNQIDYWILQAYTTGLSRAMLVLAAFCLISSAVVYIGLRNYKISQVDFPD